MFDKIAALILSPLWLAVAGGKAKSKPGRKPVRAKRPAPPSRAKRPAKKSPPPKAEEPAVPPEPEEPPPPPPPPIQAPGLLYPAQGETTDSLTPSFRWMYVGGATHFQMVWSLDPHFHKQHILLTTQTRAELPPEEALRVDAAYSWRVRAGNGGGWGPWSPARLFRTPGQ